MKTLLTILLMLFVATALAGPSTVFNYQGFLSEIDGTPLDGFYNLTFRIYEVPVDDGANPALWTEVHNGVQVTTGVFSVLLGSLTVLPPALLESAELYVGVTVGTDDEVTPRLQLTSTPWAYRAAIADSAVVTGAGGSGGTVTSVETGAGLTGGPITSSGTIEVAPGGITGNMIEDHSVSTPDYAFNSIYGSHIAGNGVYDDNILDEPGISMFGNINVNNLYTFPIDAASCVINTPTSGYVVATFSGYGQLLHNTGTWSEIALSISQTSAVHDSTNIILVSVTSNQSTGNRRYPMSITDAFYVDSGGSHWFYLVAESDFGADNTLHSGTLLLTYYPTLYGVFSESKQQDVEPRE